MKDLALLEVRNLRASLGAAEIVKGVSFSVQRGEFVALIGPNGAGKTTILRAAAGLLDYEEGSVTLDGNPISSMTHAQRARLLAYLPQGRIAYWPMSVRDIVALGRLPHRAALTRLTSEDQAAIDQALAAAELQPLAARRIDALSEGERARVMMARALAQGAPLLLADEPTAALDPYHQIHLMEVLLAQAQSGAAVLAILHDLALVEQFAARVILLCGGTIIADGPPGEALTPERLEAAYRIRQRGAGSALGPRWSRIQAKVSEN